MLDRSLAIVIPLTMYVRFACIIRRITNHIKIQRCRDREAVFNLITAEQRSPQHCESHNLLNSRVKNRMSMNHWRILCELLTDLPGCSTGSEGRLRQKNYQHLKCQMDWSSYWERTAVRPFVRDASRSPGKVWGKRRCRSEQEVHRKCRSEALSLYCFSPVTSVPTGLQTKSRVMSSTWRKKNTLCYKLNNDLTNSILFPGLPHLSPFKIPWDFHDISLTE